MSFTDWVRSKYIKVLSGGPAPYQVNNDIYHRFDQRNNLTVGRPNWDESIRAFTQKAKGTRIRHIREGNDGYHLEDYSLFFSAGAVASRLGTSINQSNRGLTSWTSLGKAAEEDMVAPDLPDDISRWSGSPQDASRLIKRAAKFFGADVVGIAPLDPRWIFSHAYWIDGSHKEIKFEEVDDPAETEQCLIIPQKMRWVIIMGMAMNYETIGFVPSPTGCAETQATYSRMAFLVSGMAEFLRGMNYHAIPSLNDLGLNIPMAIGAGLGEQGRNGKLINPIYGPNMRLCKVITDLPLDRDYPISFGVKKFCDQCKKCAQNCPAKAIPLGEPAWSGSSISNNPGVYTWHLNNEACRKYWAAGPGTNCTVCIRSCPFTKNAGAYHELVRFFIGKVPRLNPIWRLFDDLLGYGAQIKRPFWSEGN